MNYTIIKTNDNNTVDVELNFPEYDYTVVASNVPLGETEMDLENNIIEQARTIKTELYENLKVEQPYEPTLNQPKTVTLE